MQQMRCENLLKLHLHRLVPSRRQLQRLEAFSPLQFDVILGDPRRHLLSCAADSRFHVNLRAFFYKLFCFFFKTNLQRLLFGKFFLRCNNRPQSEILHSARI